MAKARKRENFRSNSNGVKPHTHIQRDMKPSEQESVRVRERVREQKASARARSLERARAIQVQCNAILSNCRQLAATLRRRLRRQRALIKSQRTARSAAKIAGVGVS